MQTNTEQLRTWSPEQTGELVTPASVETDAPVAPEVASLESEATFDQAPESETVAPTLEAATAATSPVATDSEMAEANEPVLSAANKRLVDNDFMPIADEHPLKTRLDIAMSPVSKAYGWNKMASRLQNQRFERGVV